MNDNIFMMASNNFDNQRSLFDCSQKPQSNAVSPAATANSAFITNSSDPSPNFAQACIRQRLLADTASPLSQHHPDSLHQLHSHNTFLTNDQTSYVVLDGQPQSVDSVLALISTLRHDVEVQSEQIIWLQAELERLQRIVGDRERNVDQLKSVLDQKFITPEKLSASTQGLDRIAEGPTEMESNDEINVSHISKPPLSARARIKKQGVSGESGSQINTGGFVHYEKDER